MFQLMTTKTSQNFRRGARSLDGGIDPEVKAFIKVITLTPKNGTNSVEMAAALRELKTKIDPLPADAMPVYCEGSELRPMKELSDNEISVVQEQWHTFCHTTPPSGQFDRRSKHQTLHPRNDGLWGNGRSCGCQQNDWLRLSR